MVNAAVTGWLPTTLLKFINTTPQLVVGPLMRLHEFCTTLASQGMQTPLLSRAEASKLTNNADPLTAAGSAFLSHNNLWGVHAQRLLVRLRLVCGCVCGLYSARSHVLCACAMAGDTHAFPARYRATFGASCRCPRPMAGRPFPRPTASSFGSATCPRLAPPPTPPPAAPPALAPPPPALGLALGLATA